MCASRLVRSGSRAVVLAALLGAVSLAGCGRHGHQAPAGGSSLKPSQMRLKRNVELAPVQRQKLAASIDTVGYLEAEGQTDIAAGVSGVVDEVLFREGEWVDRNTILVKVDQKRYQTAVEVARANEARAESSANSNRELERIMRGAGAGTSLEERARVAGAARVAEAELAAARAARVLAEINLDRSQVRAPYTGQINSRRITIGTYLEDKTVIGTMADLTRLRLVGYIPEKMAPTVRELLARDQRDRTTATVAGWLAGPWTGVAAAAVDSSGLTPGGYEVSFTVRSYPRQTFTARLFYLSSVANPETHMFECKSEVTTRGLPFRLAPGFTAKITCPLPGSSDSVVVPEEAVRASERGFVAFRPRALAGKEGQIDWVAEPVTVQLGLRRPGLVEVLEGLSPDDWIVTKGAEALEDGTPINVPDDLAARILPKKD